MKIQTFKNGRGLIYGKNAKRLTCHKTGVLKIGDTEIKLVSGAESSVPLLFYGGTGKYAATFTDHKDGRVYDLGKVEVHEGLISAPPSVAVEIMELRYRLDQSENECEALKARVTELENMFDTNALNFLIG